MFQFTLQNAESADLLASLFGEEPFIPLSANQDIVHAELPILGLQKNPKLNQIWIKLGEGMGGEDCRDSSSRLGLLCG